MKGKRIVVTRALDQAEALSALLRAQGAEPLLYPCIAIAPPADTTALDTALHAAVAGHFHWLVFTSTNAVLAVAQRLADLGTDLRLPEALAIAAIGPATAAAVSRLLHLPVRLLPEQYVAEALAQAMQVGAQDCVLLPQADIARAVLAQELSKAGAQVTAMVAYRTVRGSGGVDLPQLLATGQVDAITFTSPSTVRHCLQRLQEEGGRVEQLHRLCIACLGPQTAEAATACGLPIAVMPRCHTLAGLIAGLTAYFAGVA